MRKALLFAATLALLAMPATQAQTYENRHLDVDARGIAYGTAISEAKISLDGDLAVADHDGYLAALSDGASVSLEIEIGDEVHTADVEVVGRGHEKAPHRGGEAWQFHVRTPDGEDVAFDGTLELRGAPGDGFDAVVDGTLIVPDPPRPDRYQLRAWGQASFA